ncbi:MAG: biopolymer transporter ExbD [Chitinophagaceae bacterium]
MKYLIPFLLLFAACKTSPHSHQHNLSLIVLTDTIVAYAGNLDKETKIERIAMNEKDFKALIERIYGGDTSDEIFLKPEAMANVIGNTESIITWCKDLKIATPQIVPSSPEDNKYLGFAGMPEGFYDNFKKPESVHLNLPQEEQVKSIKPTDKTYTILLLKNDIAYVYLGEDPERKVAMAKISDSAIKNCLIEGQKKYKNDFFVIIKPLKDASYRNTVDILDEMISNDIKRYSMIESTEADVILAEKLQAIL